jgi:hypothetical protein
VPQYQDAVRDKPGTANAGLIVTHNEAVIHNKASFANEMAGSGPATSPFLCSEQL